ncbi:MAG: hypothetical protein KC635_14095, partial [Myxococcales bacterium]|nr:hypothetical protein [Myxococcales bacterium]
MAFGAALLALAGLASPASAATTCPTGGDVTISAACVFEPGTYAFGSFTIAAGVTVTANSRPAGVTAGPIVIQAGSASILGTLTADGTGYAANTGPPGYATSGGAGGSHGGR